jgi:hypothetical protein
MVSSGLLRRVALVRTDVSEEPGASFIRVTKIGELGKTPFFKVTAVKTSNRTYLFPILYPDFGLHSDHNTPAYTLFSLRLLLDQLRYWHQ